MRYINKYASSGDVTTALENETLLKPYVVLLEDNDTIDFNSQDAGHDYSKDYLTFEMLSDGGLKAITNSNNLSYPLTIEYSVNNGDWNSLTVATSFTDYVISNLKTGDKVRFRGNNAKYATYTNRGLSIRGTNNETYNIYGNILSLINSTGYTTVTGFSADYVFSALFTYGGVISAENLVLPNFTGKYCYGGMFMKCTSLITAPELPATTLAEGCYQEMFYNCSHLNYIKCLANIASSNNLSSWVYKVSSTGTFVKKAGVTWPSGINGIPDGWTVVEV